MNWSMSQWKVGSTDLRIGMGERLGASGKFIENGQWESRRERSNITNHALLGLPRIGVNFQFKRHSSFNKTPPTKLLNQGFTIFGFLNANHKPVKYLSDPSREVNAHSFRVFL